MANFSVTKEIVELYDHYNADSLEVLKAGNRQYVVQKDLYKSGDIIVQIPEKAILPPDLAIKYSTYLTGKEKNIVKSIKLRNEISEGIVLSLKEASEYIDSDILQNIECGIDLSSFLNIKEYEPPIPFGLRGQIKNLNYDFNYKYDVDQLGIYSHKIDNEDNVLVSEKIHGSQFNAILKVSSDGKIIEEYITSKGLNKRNQVIEYSKSNFYWQAWNNVKDNLAFDNLDIVNDFYIQLIGEAIPCQKNYDYSQVKPTIRFFLGFLEGVVLYFSDLQKIIPIDLIVPVIYMGKYKDVKNNLRELADKKRSYLDDKTISEGLVVTVRDKFIPPLKVISKHYKQTGEEFN